MFRQDVSKGRVPVSDSFVPRDNNGHVINPVVVDQYSGQEFNINQFGWMKSDVDILLQADSLSVQEKIMSRLQLLKDDPSNKDKSDQELIQSLIPRTVQSYGELSMFMDWYKQKYGEPLFEPQNDSDKPSDEPTPDGGSSDSQ